MLRGEALQVIPNLRAEEIKEFVESVYCLSKINRKDKEDKFKTFEWFDGAVTLTRRRCLRNIFKFLADNC